MSEAKKWMVDVVASDLGIDTFCIVEDDAERTILFHAFDEKLAVEVVRSHNKELDETENPLDRHLTLTPNEVTAIRNAHVSDIYNAHRVIKAYREEYPILRYAVGAEDQLINERRRPLHEMLDTIERIIPPESELANFDWDNKPPVGKEIKQRAKAKRRKPTEAIKTGIKVSDGKFTITDLNMASFNYSDHPGQDNSLQLRTHKDQVVIKMDFDPKEENLGMMGVLAGKKISVTIEEQGK